MTKRMLIDATHAEETRVVVLDGNRLEDFDVETSTKRQLKGNIYLAKVVRVEPSLQAAFVEYGGGRHGFLAFGEIHPDYYQIPVADRQRLLEMQAEDARREEEEEDRAAAAEEAGETISANVREIEISYAEPETIEHGPGEHDSHEHDPNEQDPNEHDRGDHPIEDAAAEAGASHPADPETPEPLMAESTGASEPAETSAEPEPAAQEVRAQPAAIGHETVSDTIEALTPSSTGPQPEFSFTAPPAPAFEPHDAETAGEETHAAEFGDATAAPAQETDPAESPTQGHTGQADRSEQDHPADSAEDQREQRIPPRFLRNYKIQEVIKRRQILLIQVVKEERGTKGAALTTYISLAGRFCVLMPNSPRGGGISRKITSAADRRRLKEITAELAIPKGMGLIVRTAGAQRPKPEIKRDCEYLMRLWDDIREYTMRSVAPALIYEEASLIKRAIRDGYSRDIDEVIVDGEEGWRAAHDFMRMLMPAHAKKVQLWRDPNGQPLFARHQVDTQLDAMMSPTVQLKSGGYLVINQAEALVAVDVNSGRSTRERGIEETALRTNLEAADEVARQLRLRDLAGLIVIDFIDMEAKKHNTMVERRLKEALKNDRARIQVGQISHFGLLEMSRQRLRPSLAETSFVTCPHCGGLGHVRSTESAAIQVLRAIEEEGARRRSAEIVVYAATSIALYVLNHKRDRLIGIEARYGMHVTFASDEALLPPNIRIERVRALLPGEGPATVPQDAWQSLPPPAEVDAEVEDEDVPDTAASDTTASYSAADAPEEAADDAAEAAEADATGTETAEEAAERSRRKRRRRRRGGRREDGTADTAPQAAEPGADDGDVHGEVVPSEVVPGEPIADQEAGETVTTEPASPEAAATAEDASGTEDEEAQRRRRGRRGGRRRRRDEETPAAISEPGAEQPDVPPAYTGPTPANPFGGHGYDIFDALERAEEQAARTAQAPVAPAEVAPAGVAPAEPDVAELEATPTAMAAASPSETVPMASGMVIVPISSTPPAEEAVQPQAPEPEPEAEPEAVPEPESVPEPVIGTIIQPIVIGETAAPPAEKKRGWWRR
jgi:ribonuclease E